VPKKFWSSNQKKKSGGTPIKNPALAPKAIAYGTPAPDMETRSATGVSRALWYGF
tara:strand:- start:160 stop:324 length:165 start_codon:yes stop_codon:yes gene_type:complete